MSSRISIYYKESLLAEGELDKDVILTDGNYYFNPEAVKLEHFQRTDRKYTCPYKGNCDYVDLIDPETKEVITEGTSWIYDNPKPGWEKITGKYGFYTFDRGDVVVKEENN